MDTNVTSIGSRSESLFGELFGEGADQAGKGFAGMLGRYGGEAALGVAGGAAAMALDPSTMTGATVRRGEVEGQPGLSFSYHPDELAVTISRAGADGSRQPMGVLMRDGSDALHDGHGGQVGQLWTDGSISLDAAWLQARPAGPSIHADPIPDGPSVPRHTGAPPPVVPQSHVESFPAAQLAGATHTGSPAPQGVGGHTESFPASEDRGPAIFEAQRNRGVEGYPGLKSYSPQARASAEISDSAVTRVLQPGDWQAHHLIPLKVIRDNLDLFGALSRMRGGFWADEPANILAVPKNEAAQKALAAEGISRPIQNGSHKDYNRRVQNDVDGIKQELTEEKLKPGTPGYEERASELMEELLNDLRQRQAGISRLTEAVPEKTSQAA